MVGDFSANTIKISGASEHNLKDIDLEIDRGQLTVVTGVSGSGKSSLAFDTVLAEAQRRFFYTLSHYSRQFLDLGTRPAVKHVSGLSPAIALAQNETMPSRRATVGSLSDVSELLGVCFARFGDKSCPKHGLPTESLSPIQIAEHISSLNGKTVALCAPLAEKKKGNFATKLQRFVARGYSKAYIDGEICSLSPVPELAKEEKHTIKVIIDLVKVSEKNRGRLLRSIETTIEEGAGFGEYYVAKSGHELDLENGGGFSVKGGCPKCGHSWPKLDARYFSANSLGKCESCFGLGRYVEYDDDYYYEDDEQSRLNLADNQCEDCEGTGLSPEYSAITLAGVSAVNLQSQSVGELSEFFDGLVLKERFKENPAFMRVAEQIQTNLARIIEVGLEYLELKRRVRTLSGGELQRLKLAGILGESLRGVLYVLDEPSQGLHPAEIDRLCRSLKDLTSRGNTVLVVDHDETLMRQANWIIDLGPGGGARGGSLLAKFKPEQASSFGKQSLTAGHLTQNGSSAILDAKSVRSHMDLTVSGAHLHNLDIESVKFKKKALNVVTGVSGSGKSSLVLGTLFENAKEYVASPKRFKFRYCSKIEGLDDYSKVELIDRKKVAKSSVSMPATYLDIFTELRTLYGKLPESQVAGLTAASYSLAREGGRCEECRGRGEVSLTMRFLPDARVRCHVCGGDRYRPHLLEIKYNGLSLSDVLKLTIDEAFKHFETFKKIKQRLQPAIDLGLGYLKLGQPSSSLSGGEAQRLKLVPFLVKKHGESSLVLIDEPTTGLHFEDVGRLLSSLRNLVDRGATVILIEHNLDVARSCDWLVDLGPGSAGAGGRVMYQGTPAKMSKKVESPTARYINA